MIGMDNEDITITELLRRIENLEQIVDDLKRVLKGNANVQPKNEKSESIKELMLRAGNPKSKVVKTLLVGYYLESVRGMPSFNITDIENGFREAKEPLSKNPNTDVNRNIERGLIMEANEKKDKLKAWQLTSSGERFAEGLFQKVNYQ